MASDAAAAGGVGGGGDYVLVLWRRLRLDLHIRMTYSLFVWGRWVSSTSSDWCDLRAWINWAAVAAEFWLVTVVVISPPMVHRDYRQDVVVMRRVSQAGAASRAFAGVAAPDRDADGGDDEQDQQQRHDQVERVDSTHHGLQPSRRTTLTDIFLPEPPLQLKNKDTQFR